MNTQIDSEKDIISDRLKKLQQKSGLNQKDYAAQFGISEASFYAYVKKRAIPPISLLKQICDLEKVSMDWICGHESSAYVRSFVGVARSLEAVYTSCPYPFDDVRISISQNSNGERTLKLEIDEADSEFMDMMQKLMDNLQIRGKISEDQYTTLQNNVYEYYQNKHF